MKRCVFLALMALTLALVGAPAWAAIGTVTISPNTTSVTVKKGNLDSVPYTAVVKDDSDNPMTEGTDYTSS